MTRIQELAEKTFGAVCYAGFDSVLWAVEDDLHLATNTLNTYRELNKYKWQILDKAMQMRPSITDLYRMAEIITFITDGKVVYNDEDLDAYQEQIESLMP